MNIINKARRALACMLVQKKQTLNLNEAVVSFTFDDVPDSGLINGSAILKKYGFAGTYYLALGMQRNDRAGGPCNDIQQIKKIAADGGELACHTYGHIHLYSSGKREIISDLEKNKSRIAELIPGYTFSNFSYPYGEQTVLSKKITRDRYKSARSIKGGMNTNPVDLNNLKAVELSGSYDVKNVLDYINKAIERKAWLIFYTHDVAESHSPYGCSPQYFEKIVSHCSERKVKVHTVAGVLASGIILASGLPT